VFENAPLVRGMLVVPSFRPSVRPSFLPSFTVQLRRWACACAPLSAIWNFAFHALRDPFSLPSFFVSLLFGNWGLGYFASTPYSDASLPSFFSPPSFLFFRPCRPFRHSMFRGECTNQKNRLVRLPPPPCLRVGVGLPPHHPSPIAQACISVI
jgi:hypothetical protein